MKEIKIISSPKSINIAITGRCNLACQYCFYSDEMIAYEDLPTERWVQFFDELGRLGVMNVCLTGGEVFTRPDLFELIDCIISNRMRYTLLSNGTLITQEIIEKLELGKRRQRLDSIQISVDGSSANIHNLSRPMSFERALSGLKLLKKAKFPITVRVTINRHNVHDLENTAHLLLSEVGISSFGTNEAYACGATDRTEGTIILTPTQRQEAMQVLTRLSEQYNRRIHATAGPLILAQDLRTMDTMLADGHSHIPGRGTLSACRSAFSDLSVLHNGTIVPCIVLSTLHLGTIGTDSILEIWQSHPILTAMRQRAQIPLSSLKTCQKCKYQGFCSGGCPGGALYFNGDINTRNPMDCYRVLKGEDPFFTLQNG